MTNFEKCFYKLIKNEGGYVNDPQDAGGETYKGIARNRNSKWKGWQIIDLAKRQSNFPSNLETMTNLQEEIKEFYKLNYWDKVAGDSIVKEDIAHSIFDFGVNAGVGTSILLAQKVLGLEPLGVINNETLEKLNSIESDIFISQFILAKIVRYLAIVKKNPNNKKFFYGWIKRALEQ